MAIVCHSDPFQMIHTLLLPQVRCNTTKCLLNRLHCPLAPSLLTVWIVPSVGILDVINGSGCWEGQTFEIDVSKWDPQVDGVMLNIRKTVLLSFLQVIHCAERITYDSLTPAWRRWCISRFHRWILVDATRCAASVFRHLQLIYSSALQPKRNDYTYMFSYLPVCGSQSSNG